MYLSIGRWVLSINKKKFTRSGCSLDSAIYLFFFVWWIQYFKYAKAKLFHDTIKHPYWDIYLCLWTQNGMCGSCWHWKCLPVMIKMYQYIYSFIAFNVQFYLYFLHILHCHGLYNASVKKMVKGKTYTCFTPSVTHHRILFM